jgi:hypothetical protein
MNEAFVIRRSSLNNILEKESDKPDGSFIKNNGLFTDSLSHAKVFASFKEAEDFWRFELPALIQKNYGAFVASEQVQNLFIVKVKVKLVAYRVLTDWMKLNV